LDQLFPLNNQKSNEEKQIWKDIEDKRMSLINSKKTKFIFPFFFVKEYPQLPSLIEISEIKKEELVPPDQKQIDENLKKMIQLFIKLILPFVFFRPFFFTNE